MVRSERAIAATVAAALVVAAGAAVTALLDRTSPPGAEAPATPDGSDRGAAERTIYDLTGNFAACVGDDYSLIGRFARTARHPPSRRAQILRIAGVVGAVRDLKVTRPPRTVIVPRDVIARRAGDSVDRGYSQQDASVDARVFVALGALDRRVDLRAKARQLVEQQVLGFYSPDSGRLFASAGEEKLRLVDEVVLAHEIAHALVDRQIGLPRLSGDRLDSDEVLARRSFVEGDASLTALHYVMATRTPQELAAAGGDLAALTQNEPARTGDIPYLMRRLLEFPYEEGLAFVCDRFDAGGWRAIRRLYRHPPRSTAEILFPERYGQGAKPATPAPPPRLRGRWERVRRDVVGAADLLTLFESPGGRAPETPGRRVRWVTGWNGGRLDVWQRNARIALSMTINQLRRRAAPPLCRGFRKWHEETFPTARVMDEGGGSILWSRRGGFAGVGCSPRAGRFVYAPDRATARRLLAAG